MKKIEYIVGWLLLAAAAVGVYFLFHGEPSAQEEAQPEIVTEVPVHVGLIQQADLRQFIEAYGRVDAALPVGKTDLSQMPVTAAVDGVLSEINPSSGSLGTYVEKGQVMFGLDSRSMDVELARAEAKKEFAGQELDRVKKLVEAQAASQKEYQQTLFDLREAEKTVEAARIKRSYLTIRAPMSGTIISFSAVLGQAVSKGRTLAEIRDQTRLFVTAGVAGRQAAGLRLNQPVRIIFGLDNGDGTFADEICSGRILYIDSEADPQTGSVRVQAQPDNGEIPGLRKGQLVKLDIEQAVHRQCLAVDVEAVVKDLDGKSYIAVVEGQTARRCYVKTKIRQGNRIEIEGDGLSAGMSVVTKGAYGLPDKTRIRLLERQND
ncbi:MAG: efflux RND transporter periplasmic adaptor subunit [Planctomycetes bacterium]|nr:efflux RND transporter periplasmic adaptor subunit [Planctomycetota bacterium]